MSRLRRHTLFALGTLFAAALPARRAEAQSQTVTFTFSVPVTLQNIHPDIKEVALNCQINGAVMGPTSGSWEFISSMAQATPGTRTASLVHQVTASVPADKGGTEGNYFCSVKGRTSTGTTQTFHTGQTDLRFKVASAFTSNGTFTW